MSNGISVITKNQTYKKANVLIESKYKSSIMENKILAIGMAKAKKEDGRAVARISSGELISILGLKKNHKISGSFYTRLKETAQEMTSRRIFIDDYENHSFTIINLIGSATYSNNVFTIKFEPDITGYIMDLKSNYTKLSLPILMSFDSKYSYRLYEILKSKSFYNNSTENNDEFVASFGLSELKLDIGVVDTNTEQVIKMLKRANPDFDKMVNEVSKDKNFSAWSDFKKKVIDVAVKEINEKSDLDIRYKTIREGHGGKVTNIIFYFSFKDKKSDMAG